MSELSIERYHQFLADIRAAADERARGEAELAELVRQAGPGPSGPGEEALAVERAYQEAVADADAALAEITRETDAWVGNETSVVEFEYEDNVKRVNAPLDDESPDNPKRKHELLKKEIQETRESLTAKWEPVKEANEKAVEIAAKRGVTPDETLTAKRTASSLDEAAEAFEAAATEIPGHLDDLRGLFVPRVFSGGKLFLLSFVLVGGLSALAWFQLDTALIGLPDAGPAIRVVVAGLCGLLPTAALVLTLQVVAQKHTAAAYTRVQQSAVDAQAMIKLWNETAQRELKEHAQQSKKEYTDLVRNREKSLAEIEQSRQTSLAEIEKERERRTGEANTVRQRALREAAANRDRGLAAAEASSAMAHDARTAAQRQRFSELNAAWNDRVGQLEGSFRAITNEDSVAFPAWDAVLAPEWEPAESIPHAVRIGDYRLDVEKVEHAQPTEERLARLPEQYLLPAVLPFPTTPSLLAHAEGAGRNAGADVLRTAMLRLLTLLPPGKLRYTVFDPVGLGENFSAFMHLADYDELLVTNRIWTEPQQIDAQLARLTEHMENVFQKYLRNEFETIEEYNEHAGEVAEPYRFLVVHNFPAGFSDRAAQRLVSVASSGPRCGVYTLVTVDANAPKPHGFDLKDLESEGTMLLWDDGTFVNPELHEPTLPLVHDAPPPAETFAAVVRKMGELSKDSRRVVVPFGRIAPTADDYWTGDSRKTLDVPLGRAGATKIQNMMLGIGTSQHVLMAGKTGSGKSTLLHILITNLALKYSPDEVELYLIDFKKGVEFKTYASHRLPHVRVVAVESDREFGVSVLERLDAILHERGELFREYDVHDVASYRKACPDKPMPRILFIVDEFQEFFTEDDQFSQRASQLLDRLVRQGRAFGMHVLMGSQTLGGAYSLARTTIGQMAVRIALQCSEADAHLILNDENSAAKLLTRPGEAIYNDANGMVEGNNPFQVAWLEDEDRDERLAQIDALSRERGFSDREMIVFEGNVPADPAHNVHLVKVVEDAAAGTLARANDRAVNCWLGDAVAITGPTLVAFRQQSGSHLLVVGQQGEQALGLLATTLATAVAHHDVDAGVPESEPFFVFTSNAGEEGRTDRWQAVVDVLPHPVKVVGPNDAGNVVNDLAAEVTRRQTTGGGPPVFVFVDDLSRFRDLRKSDDDFGSFAGFGTETSSKPASPGASMQTLLKDGPALGIHLVVWVDSYNNVDRWFGRALLREFEMRVVFQMSGNDSSSLIDSPAAAKLGTNRALLYRDERGTTEKFRPYGPPSAQWLGWLARTLGGGMDSVATNRAATQAETASPVPESSTSEAVPAQVPSDTSSEELDDNPDDLDLDSFTFV